MNGYGSCCGRYVTLDSRFLWRTLCLQCIYKTWEGGGGCRSPEGLPDITALVMLPLPAASSGLERQFRGSLPGWSGASCLSEEESPVPPGEVANGDASHPFLPLFLLKHLV